MATKTFSGNRQGEKINRVMSPEEITRQLKFNPNLAQSSRRIHKVSPQLRMKDRQGDTVSVYDPSMVSLGPYHHGKPEFRQTEEFKYLCLHSCSQGTDAKKRSLYNMILEDIDVVRGCYAESLIINQYNDAALALMMLLDACFILCFIQIIRDGGKTQSDWCKQLGMASIPLTARDIMILENQIPFSVLKRLMVELYTEEEGKSLIQKLLSWILIVEPEKVSVNLREDPPLHVLEACWRVIAAGDDRDQKPANNQGFFSFLHRHPSRWWSRLIRTGEDEGSQKDVLPVTNHRTCRSVTDLRAKGICIHPSSSHSLKDIRFKSSHLYGQIQLPVRHVSDQTHVILSNMIAYEISPDVETDLAVLSYTKFMKSLIETPADVKELQEKGIIVLNRFANLDQVVQMFKSIDTLGLENTKIYEDVMQQAGEHYNNLGKTWMADLIHSKLSSPWTIVALLSTILLLGLTFLQTFYTIHPRNS